MQEQNPKLSRLINTVKYIKEYAKKAIISNILSNLKKMRRIVKERMVK